MGLVFISVKYGIKNDKDIMRFQQTTIIHHPKTQTQPKES